MKIILSKINETYFQIKTEKSILKELSEYFTFEVPGFRFMPAYRNKLCDGKKRLVNYIDSTIYCGLLPYIKKFAANNTYDLEYENFEDYETSFSVNEAEDFFNALRPCSGSKEITPHDYQISTFRTAVQRGRVVIVSPTSSGKSLCIYSLVRWYHNLGKKILIVLPGIGLVSQLYGDFENYSYLNGWDVENNCHQIFQGQNKNTDKLITISTWQSIYKLNKKWFSQFDVVIGDEVHGFKAESLTSILHKCINAEYRFGFTGTLQDTKIHRLVIEGLFGAAKEIITTKELIDRKNIADIAITCLLLHYSESDCKFVKNMTYSDEIQFIAQHEKRMNFISNLALSLEGNTLVLFRLVDKHGKKMFDRISEKNKNNIPIYFVDGKVDVDIREKIRSAIELHEKSITLASVGVFSEGVNIKRIHNIILATPVKSEIKNRQGIGRGLRLGDDKHTINYYDIVDVLSLKSKKNFALKHFLDRVKIYDEQQFNYKTYNINI